jgi:hypothetical protein
MGQQGPECVLLEKILKNSKKLYVCPLCFTSYSEASSFFKHCRKLGKGKGKEKGRGKKGQQADPIHEGLGAVNTKGDFGKFVKSLGIAIGWERITIDKLPLDLDKSGPREYGACFKVRFVVEMKTRLDPHNTAERFAILRHIAKLAGIHYACPLCMSGFATSDRVLQHCEHDKDEHHKGLLSEEQNDFLAFYANSMGQILECDDLKINYDEYGRPDFRECFQLDEILKCKRKTAVAAAVIAKTSF